VFALTADLDVETERDERRAGLVCASAGTAEPTRLASATVPIQKMRFFFTWLIRSEEL